MSNQIYIAPTGDGWLNLARDEYFLDTVEKGDILLYFYVNTNAVIIGRNQNAWKECNLASMEAQGVQLVRRHTGGGAVFHDTGNLNFSFIMNERDYNLQRQLRVILTAVRQLGLDAELSGRNDLLIDGRKFSGNAYGLSRGNRSHHGTLLVDANLDLLPNYLNVSQSKMRAKGIASVRSRVCNISEFYRDITVPQMMDMIIASFNAEYGDSCNHVLDDEAIAEINKRYIRQKSWEWRFGKTPEFDYCIDKRFSFGEMQIHLTLKDGIIRRADVYTDALDTDIADEVSKCLCECRFDAECMAKRVTQMTDKRTADEIADCFLTETV